MPDSEDAPAAPTGESVIPLENLIGDTFPATLARARVARVSVTTPPYPCLGQGKLRVVAIRPGPSLILSYDTYYRLPRPCDREG